MNIDEKIVLAVIEKSTIRSFVAGREVMFENGALVLKGKVYEGEQRWIVEPENMKWTLATDCILLILPTDFYLSFDLDNTLGHAFEKFCRNSERVKKDIEVEDLNEIIDSRIDESSCIMPIDVDFTKFKSRGNKV